MIMQRSVFQRLIAFSMVFLVGAAVGLAAAFTVSFSPFCKYTDSCLRVIKVVPELSCEGLRQYKTPRGNVICAKNDKALTGRIYPRNWPERG